MKDYIKDTLNYYDNNIDSYIDVELFAKSISYDYDDLFQKLQSGEINYSQLGDYIFPRI